MSNNCNADNEHGGDVDLSHYEKVGGEWEVGPVGWGGDGVENRSKYALHPVSCQIEYMRDTFDFFTVPKIHAWLVLHQLEKGF